MSGTVYVVGRLLNYAEKAWVFQGVFSEEQKAVDACLDWRFFVGPAKVDEVLPLEDAEWPGAYYPKADVSIRSHEHE